MFRISWRTSTKYIASGRSFSFSFMPFLPSLPADTSLLYCYRIFAFFQRRSYMFGYLFAEPFFVGPSAADIYPLLLVFFYPLAAHLSANIGALFRHIEGLLGRSWQSSFFQDPFRTCWVASLPRVLVLEMRFILSGEEALSANWLPVSSVFFPDMDVLWGSVLPTFSCSLWP